VKRIFENNLMVLLSRGKQVRLLLKRLTVFDKRLDVVVLDMSLAGRDGLEVLKELKQIRPRLPVLILTMYSEGLFARRAFKAGASGYVTKKFLEQNC